MNEKEYLIYTALRGPDVRAEILKSVFTGLLRAIAGVPDKTMVTVRRRVLADSDLEWAVAYLVEARNVYPVDTECNMALRHWLWHVEEAFNAIGLVEHAVAAKWSAMFLKDSCDVGTLQDVYRRMREAEDAMVLFPPMKLEEGQDAGE